MSKDEWRHTHTGEGGEELYQSKENKYYTKFAWDHFLAAYTGKVRPAHRDRPPVADASNGWDSAWSPSVAKGIIDFYSNGTDLWPADEKTDPMPQTVISPRQLTPAQKLKKKP